MCGLVGFSGATNSEVLEKMTEAIHHRGPDAVAYMVSRNFSIGYRRLAIIDLSAEYPMKNEKETIELVLNGEIYNYLDLRKELEEQGHEFKSNSDSETIVHGYEEWGEGILEKLRGMFVFVLYDKLKDQLFIARDRLGIKPLYYAQHDGRFVFGSEIKGIFSSFDVSREPNDKIVTRFLHKRLHDIDEETFFKHVKRLLPGHFMYVNADGSFDIKKYWDPSFNPNFSKSVTGEKKSDADYAEEFKEIFSEAVKIHLLADVPIGVTLSGGLDSSGITALSKKLFDEAATIDQQANGKKGEVIAFSAIHPGEKVDESEYIDSVVKATGIKSVKIQPNVDNFWEELDTWTYFQEEPVISTAPYAYYTVMREARKEVTVLLSGQGGDELLAGYIPYFLTYLQTAMDQKKLWPAIRETWMGKDLYFKYFLEKMNGRRNSDNVIDPTRSLNLESRISNIGTENKMELDSRFQILDSKNSRNLNERLFQDVTSLTTPCLLRYEDKNSMAHSLESRVPFFDHKVVEYIFNLPIDQKIKFGWNRFIYRNAMKGIIPEMNRLRRSKVGFTNPESEWIQRKSDKFMEVFQSESFKARPYWKADKVIEDFDRYLKGELAGDDLYFWRLFSVETWMRTYVD